MTNINIRSYAQFEREEIMLDGIKKHFEGVSLTQLSKELNISKIILGKIAKELYKKRKIKIIRLGRSDIYAIR